MGMVFPYNYVILSRNIRFGNNHFGNFILHDTCYSLICRKVKPSTQSSIFLADCLSRPAEQAPGKPTFVSFIHQFSQEGDADDEDH
jgi:hypothetical protein